MTKYIVNDKWVRLLNYNINKPPLVGSMANSLLLPHGNTVTMVRQATNGHKIPHLYFTVDDITQVKKQGAGKGGAVSAKDVYVAPLHIFKSATSSANGDMNANGLEKGTINWNK